MPVESPSTTRPLTISGALTDEASVADRTTLCVVRFVTRSFSAETVAMKSPLKAGADRGKPLLRRAIRLGERRWSECGEVPYVDRAAVQYGSAAAAALA